MFYEMSDYQAAREQYDYMPAHLKRPTSTEPATAYLASLPVHQVDISDWYSQPSIRRNYSSLALDEYHGLLLNSDLDDELLLGLLSVMYWGFAAGTDKKIRFARALRRSEAILVGRANALPQEREGIIRHLRQAREHLLSNRAADALVECCRIKFLQMAFASKVLAFMKPELAAVYDDVISLRLGNSQNEKNHSTSPAR